MDDQKQPINTSKKNTNKHAENAAVSAPSETAEPSKPPADVFSQSSLKTVKGARWYVVHTYSGHENKVAATLEQRIDSQKHA